MDVLWLKGLAGRLRDVLADKGMTVTHGQALDASAAVVGLRNWPEVNAFARRVVEARFDRPALERLRRRIESRWNIAMSCEEWLVTLALGRIADVARHAATDRLILATDSSSSGHLKMSMIADKVVALDRAEDFALLPNPLAATPREFFAARDAASAARPEEQWPWLLAEDSLKAWDDVVATCERYDRVELWADPEPNDQMLFARSATWLAQREDLRDRLAYLQAESSLGERGPEAVLSPLEAVRPLTATELDALQTTWENFCDPTPRAAAQSLVNGRQPLPRLHRALRLMLAELPAPDSGLGATQRRVLQQILPGTMRPADVESWSVRRDHQRVMGPSGIERVLVQLACCDTPAIVGLDAIPLLPPEDADERRRGFVEWRENQLLYRKSRLALTDFGVALLENRTDFTAHNLIDRWWGGTHLTNANLWRWDADRERLVAPG